MPTSHRLYWSQSAEGPERALLKVEFCSQLDDSCGDATHPTADHSEGLGTDVAIDGLRVGVEVIEQVVNLGAQLRAEAFVYRDRFVHREIEVEQSRQPNGVCARGGAEAAELGLGERSCIEPACPSALVARQIWRLAGDIRARAYARAGGIDAEVDGAPYPDCAVMMVDTCQPSSTSLVNPDEPLKNGIS